MLHKVKEIFQKLLNKKQEAPQTEAPYKIEPEIKPPAPTPVEEVKVDVVEEPVKPVKPKKPKTNQNGNRSKQRKVK